VLLKIIFAFIIIAFSETINGIFRVKYLHKKFKKKFARIFSFFTGLSMIILLSLIFVPWINPKTDLQAFSIGFIWAINIVLYDVLIGRFAFKLTWSKILDDFNLFKGNLLPIGIVIIMILPYIIWSL